MPTAKPTWAQIKNHLHYGKWIYLLIALLSWFGYDLAYTMTEYRPPDNRKVDFQLVQAGSVDADRLGALAARALEAGRIHDATLELVEFMGLPYAGDPETDVYGAQVFTVKLQAREGDLWVLPRATFEQLQPMGVFEPLDGYIACGMIRPNGADLKAFTLPAPSDEVDADGAPLAPNGEPGVYALPASLLPALAQAGYRVEDACVALVGFSTNPDTAAAVLGWLIGQPLPDAPTE